MYAPLAFSSKLPSEMHWLIHPVILGSARFFRTIFCCSGLSSNIFSDRPRALPMFILNMETRTISANGSPGTARGKGKKKKLNQMNRDLGKEKRDKRARSVRKGKELEVLK